MDCVIARVLVLLKHPWIDGIKTKDHCHTSVIVVKTCWTYFIGIIFKNWSTHFSFSFQIWLGQMGGKQQYHQQQCIWFWFTTMYLILIWITSIYNFWYDKRRQHYFLILIQRTTESYWLKEQQDHNTTTKILYIAPKGGHGQYIHLPHHCI